MRAFFDPMYRDRVLGVDLTPYTSIPYEVYEQEDGVLVIEFEEDPGTEALHSLMRWITRDEERDALEEKARAAISANTSFVEQRYVEIEKGANTILNSTAGQVDKNLAQGVLWVAQQARSMALQNNVVIPLLLGEINKP